LLFTVVMAIVDLHAGAASLHTSAPMITVRDASTDIAELDHQVS